MPTLLHLVRVLDSGSVAPRGYGDGFQASTWLYGLILKHLCPVAVLQSLVMLGADCNLKAKETMLADVIVACRLA